MKKMKYRITKIVVILLALLPLHADQFALWFYNDAFAQTDRYFTNGLGLSWNDDTFSNPKESNVTAYSRWMYELVDTISFGQMDSSQNHTAGIGVSQIMITPDDLTLSQPQYDDVPYMGYLALSFYLFEWDNRSFREYRIQAGVVGKESGAKWVQKTAHKILGDTEPKGWDTQLGTQWMFNVLYRQGYKSWRYQSANGLQMDWFNHFGFQAGNYMTSLFAGTVFRLGQNYMENFNVSYPILNEEASMLHPYGEHHGFGWSLSVGIDTEVVLYSYFCDESQKEGYGVDDRTFNALPYLGASLYYDEHTFTLFYQAQTFSLNGKNKTEIFGGFKYDIRF